MEKLDRTTETKVQRWWQGVTPPCRFLTKKRNSVPHQSSQLTEDTEVGGETRRGGEREGGQSGETGQERCLEWHRKQKGGQGNKGYHIDGETWKRESTDSVTLKYCTKGKVHGKEFKSQNWENKPVFWITFSEPLLHIPGNHLLLLIGGMASTSQDFSRSGEEVEAVVLEVLIYQRQEDL